MSRLLAFALVLGVAALVLAIVTAVAIAQKEKSRKRVRDRVLAAGGRTEAKAAAANAAKVQASPSIRIAEKSESQFAQRLARLFNYNIDNPRERSLPLPVVIALGAGISLVAYWRGRAMLGDTGGVVVSAIACVISVRAIFGWQQRRYREAVLKQIPDSLGLILRAIRAGLPMNEALRGVAREIPTPTREEFSQVVGEMSIGRPIEEALWHLYERTRLTEYAFFAVTLGLQSQTGGSLAETIENLADMVRKRVAMAAKAKALASEARMSAAILIAMPFVAAGGLALIRPGYLNVFFTTETGFNLLMTGLTLLGLGILTIRSMIRRSTAD